MYLYIVEHFLPFPISEYSGIWNVIAKDDNECFDLIIGEDDNQYSEHYNKLLENILKAQKFALKDEYQSSVIEAFLT
jgi:hypothetical protein